jgi:hypothetical protein
MILSSISKLEVLNKPPPPPKPSPKFGSTTQSIQSKDISPENYPIDVSSNVSR